MSIIFRIVENI